ncbi:VOC family protein [Kineosporia sp. J2-2]|uniref:VOC family protein n=1 Tax=Kineosporia corallincola TaxID=2835133 RepID=A0ABS5TDF0_9ACTN|nr:VOC family protein [Kineosporia corallincola]MBT0769111.1 VOC family protein [Kineosporia corallincola]
MTSSQGYGPDHPTSTGFSLHHVQLAIPVGGEDVARAFWVGVLGFAEVTKPPQLAARGGLWVRADSLEIHLGAEKEFVPAGRAHPGVLVGDLDALAKLLEQHGITVTWDDAFPGHRRFYSADPFGNRLEFLQPDGTTPAW